MIALLGIVNSTAFCVALQQAMHGQETALVPLLRALEIETWLTNLAQWNLLPAPENKEMAGKPHFREIECSSVSDYNIFSAGNDPDTERR